MYRSLDPSKKRVSDILGPKKCHPNIPYFLVYTLCRERPLAAMTNEKVIERMIEIHESRIDLEIFPWIGKPENCDENIWEIIRPCWKREAADRTDFKDLVSQLQTERRKSSTKK